MPPENSNIADFGVILDQLEEMVLSLREMGHLCVVGDFNAKLGKDAGQRAESTEWTKNGKLLYNMRQRCSLISADLTSRAVGLKYTFQRLGATGQSYIDHCLISMELMPYVPVFIEPLLENITNILKLTADNYLPKTQFRRHLKSFWNHELTKLKKKAKCAWHQWVENGRQSDDITYQIYKQSKSIYCKKVRQAESEHDYQSCQKVMYAETIDQKLFWKLVNRRRKPKQPNSSPVKCPKSGRLLHDTAKITSVWCDYFSSLAEPSGKECYDSYHQLSVVEKLSRYVDISKHNNNKFLGVPFSEDEVFRVCVNLKIIRLEV